MKKIAALLLALTLLLPAVSLAAKKPKPTDTPAPAAPTFDFTAEEWLERYQAVVGEDSEWWFEAFEVEDATPWTVFYAHDFENGLRVRIEHRDADKQISSVNAFFITGEGVIHDLETLFEKCIRASFPGMTSSEAQEILGEMNIKRLPADYTQQEFERNGVHYASGADGGIFAGIYAVPIAELYN